MIKSGQLCSSFDQYPVDEVLQVQASEVVVGDLSQIFREHGLNPGLLQHLVLQKAVQQPVQALEGGVILFIREQFVIASGQRPPDFKRLIILAEL